MLLFPGITFGRHHVWPAIAADVQLFASYSYFFAYKVMPHSKALLHPLPVPDHPFGHVTLDLLSGISTNTHGHDALLNIIDRFTTRAMVIPFTKTKGTQDLCYVLYRHISSWVGLLQTVICERNTLITASCI